MYNVCHVSSVSIPKPKQFSHPTQTSTGRYVFTGLGFKWSEKRPKLAEVLSPALSSFFLPSLPSFLPSSQLLPPSLLPPCPPSLSPPSLPVSSLPLFDFFFLILFYFLRELCFKCIKMIIKIFIEILRLGLANPNFQLISLSGFS